MQEQKRVEELRFPLPDLKYTTIEEIITESIVPSLEELRELYGPAVADALRQDRLFYRTSPTRVDSIVDFVRSRGGKAEEQEILDQYPASMRSQVLKDLSGLKEKGDFRVETKEQKNVYYIQ
ncbi:MAG: hypothetical protein AB1393_10825 [Candidatus Edwardsbacteria bacterium]